MALLVVQILVLYSEVLHHLYFTGDIGRKGLMSKVTFGRSRDWWITAWHMEAPITGITKQHIILEAFQKQNVVTCRTIQLRKKKKKKKKIQQTVEPFIKYRIRIYFPKCSKNVKIYLQITKTYLFPRLATERTLFAINALPSQFAYFSC